MAPTTTTALVALAGAAFGLVSSAPLANPGGVPSFATGGAGSPAHPSTLLREMRQPVEIYSPDTVDTMLELMSEIEQENKEFDQLSEKLDAEEGIAAVRQDCADQAPGRNPKARFLSDMAKKGGLVIEVGTTRDATLVAANYAVGYSYVYGEAGQFACARSQGFGFDSEVFGHGKVATITISPWGFESVGNKLSSPEVCLSFGWDLGLVTYGFAIELCFNGDDKILGGSIQSHKIQEKIAQFAQNELADARHRARQQTELDGERTRRSEARAMIEALRRIGNALIPASIGIEYGLSFGLLDESAEVITKGAWAVMPTVTATVSEQKLLYCEPAAECTEHPMLEGWGKNHICINNVNCQFCERKASCPWWMAGVGCLCG